jgi:SAM-dependent methyltransferase
MTRRSSDSTIANLVEYAHPNLYDLENRDFAPQGPFYLGLARRAAGPALELGCGTGRITIPIAQQGIPISGLDAVPGMLAAARAKAAGLPIEWIEADVRSFQIPAQFSLIFGTTGIFQHMLERADQEALLERVRAHLAPGGYFAFDIHFLHPEAIIQMPEEQDWFSYDDARGQKVRVSGTCHYDLIRQVWVETAYRHWQDESGQAQTHKAPLALRFFFPQELEALLHYNGFTVVEQYGDYDGSPLTADSKSMIYICQRRASQAQARG